MAKRRLWASGTTVLLYTVKAAGAETSPFIEEAVVVASRGRVPQDKKRYAMTEEKKPVMFRPRQSFFDARERHGVIPPEVDAENPTDLPNYFIPDDSAECTTDPLTGVFGDWTAQIIDVPFDYELTVNSTLLSGETTTAAGTVLLPPLETKMTDSLLPAFFKDCPDGSTTAIDGRRRQLQERSVLGLSTWPIDFVSVSQECELEALEGRVCIVVNAGLTLFTEVGRRRHLQILRHLQEDLRQHHDEAISILSAGMNNGTYNLVHPSIVSLKMVMVSNEVTSEEVSVNVLTPTDVSDSSNTVGRNNSSSIVPFVVGIIACGIFASVGAALGYRYYTDGRERTQHGKEKMMDPLDVEDDYKHSSEQTETSGGSLQQQSIDGPSCFHNTKPPNQITSPLRFECKEDSIMEGDDEDGIMSLIEDEEETNGTNGHRMEPSNIVVLEGDEEECCNGTIADSEKDTEEGFGITLPTDNTQ